MTLKLLHVEGAVSLLGCAWLNFTVVGVANRKKIRKHFNIRGTVFGDFFAFVFCGPFAVYQEFDYSVIGKTLRPDAGVKAAPQFANL